MANRFRIGELEVLAVSDGSAKVPPTLYYQGTTPEQWEPHKRWLTHDGAVEFPFACFLVRSGGRQVLIDTGLGAHPLFTFRGGALLSELAAAGVQPADIDVVFVTHLHVDHCGTCLLEDGAGKRPAFPNATYRWSAGENAHWQAAPPGQNPGNFVQKEMIAALSERFQPAEDGAALAPGLNVIATPGHTPGHAGVVLSSGGERAFVLGDAISCPAQLEETEWSGLGDMDPKLARRTQEAVAREIEGSGALLATAHFPGLTFGRVLRGRGRRYWAPL